MEIRVMANILDKNDQLAADNQARLRSKGIFTLNLLGSPGSGKTSLLEHTLAALKDEYRIAVIEGDLFTSKDADRIARLGIQVLQINTGGGCHLDAKMVGEALDRLDLDALDLIVIENVGNLVCPAEFALGEDAKVTVLSITEGEDKPLKYPLVFKEAQAVVLNKIDLLPYTTFDLAAAEADLQSIHPGLSILRVSCRTGEGLADWISWLSRRIGTGRKQPAQPAASAAALSGSAGLDLSTMLAEIEQVRRLLNELVAAKLGNTADPEVAGLSSHLDQLIVQYETLKTQQGGARSEQGNSGKK